MQLANDVFNWRRQAGRTGSLGTGPSYDHTTKTSSGKRLKTKLFCCFILEENSVSPSG